MNRKRWEDPSVPLVALALKLTEEAAEVGTEINDALDSSRKLNLSNLRDEISHVRFILRMIEERTGI